MRNQPDVPVGLLERLDRCLPIRRRVALDHGCDHVAVLDVRLPADNHPVAVGDRGADHRITHDPERDELTLADQLFGQRDDVLDQLVGENRTACGDTADQRHASYYRPPGVTIRAISKQVHHRRARASGTTAQVSLLRQRR